MIDREFDVRAYEEGYRAGKHDAQAEIERLRDENERLRRAFAGAIRYALERKQ